MEIAEQHGSQKKQVVFVAVIVLLVGYVGIMQHLGQPGDLEVSALHVRQRLHESVTSAVQGTGETVDNLRALLRARLRGC